MSVHAQDHQAQLDALAASSCREIVIETASTSNGRPELRRAMLMLHSGDTLVIYEPDRIACSAKDFLALLENELRVRNINLQILSGICAGIHRPNGVARADKMLFLVAALAAEMERNPNREVTAPVGPCAAQAHSRASGRPHVATKDMLGIADARRRQGESVTAIARHLGIGRSTLYRELKAQQD